MDLQLHLNRIKIVIMRLTQLKVNLTIHIYKFII